MTTSALHTRGLTSFFTLYGFLIMSITGIVLFVVPEGRVAYWTDWTLLGLPRTDWGNLHIMASLLFVVAGAFHTYFNWRPLMNYFADRLTQGVKLRKELAISSVVTAIVVLAALYPFPPLSYLLDLNTFAKRSWISEARYDPPYGHAERSSLRGFCQKMQIDLHAAMDALREASIQFDNADQSIEQIAHTNSLSPMELFVTIEKLVPAPDPGKLGSYTPESVDFEFTGTGIGNKTVAEMCAKTGLGTQDAVQRLEAVGLQVDPGTTLKDAARDNGTAPIEILKAMLVPGYTPLASGH